MGQPQQPPGPGPIDRREGGADLIASQDLVDGLRPGQHDGNAGAGGDLGCLDLGRHPAGADRRTDAVGVHVQSLHVGDEGDRFGVRLVRVGGVESVDIAEQDERVGTYQLRGQGGKPVIVAESDLVGGHRVVLVDDRHRTHPQQRA